MDLSQLSNEDLLALRDNGVAGLSDAGLLALQGSAPKTPQPEQKESLGRTVFDQAMQGATLGFADDIVDPLATLAVGAMNDPRVLLPKALGGKDEIEDPYLAEEVANTRQNTQNRLDRQFEQRPVASIASQMAGGLLTGGAAGSTKAGAQAGNLLRSGNIAPRIAKGVVAGAASGGLYGAGTGEDGQKLESARQGAVLGGVTGGAVPILSGAANQVNKTITPKIDQSKKAVYDIAKKYDIPLSLDDLSDSRFYQTMISEGRQLPFSGAAKKYEKTQKAYNKAVAKTFGQDADSITPDVIASAYDDLGAKFQKLTKGKTFNVGDDFENLVSGLRESAESGVYGVDGDKFLEKQLQKITKFVDDGKIKGTAIDAVRKDLNKIARGRSSAADIAGDLEEVLIDVITGSSKKAKKSFSDLKYQYKNLKTVQSIALKDQMDGNISPALLTQRVKSKFGEDAFARGEAGDLGELARLGQALKESIPNSGTSQRQLARGVLTGNLAGVAPTYLFGGAPAAAAQLGVSGLALGGNRMLQNRNTNQKLIEKLIAGTPKRNSVIFNSPNAGILSGATNR
jgi:hypothetical protein